MAGRKARFSLAHASSWLGGGGALTSGCAPPTEQIFDIPGLSRGGWYPKSAFPPPPGPDWLSASGGGVKRVGSRVAVLPPTAERGHSPTPQGEGLVALNRWKPGLLTSPFQPPCPGRPQSVYPPNGDAVQFELVGKASEAPPLRSQLSEGPNVAPSLSESVRCGSRPSSVSGLATLCVCSCRAGAPSSRRILLQFLSHINGRIRENPGRTGNSP